VESREHIVPVALNLREMLLIYPILARVLRSSPVAKPRSNEARPTVLWLRVVRLLLSGRLVVGSLIQHSLGDGLPESHQRTPPIQRRLLRERYRFTAYSSSVQNPVTPSPNPATFAAQTVNVQSILASSLGGTR
jgi:hypothetical protein